MDPINFKYYPVNAQGHAGGFFASRGTLTEDELVLDQTTIPLAAVCQVLHRYQRLAIVYASDAGPVTYTIAPNGGMDRKLKATIDRLCSYRWAEGRRAQLEREGLAAAFRTAKCPACTAVVDLSGFADTPQFYCPYCEALQPSDGRAEPEAAHYRLCDQCQYYGSPTLYTSAYLVLNAAWWQQHYSCHVCMRRECWWMLAINLLPPFIGTAWSIYNTARAYGAGIMDPYFPELVGANAYARRGKVPAARELYEAMLDRVKVQAGLRYNLAKAYARAGAWEQSLAEAEASLRDCANYAPAGAVVREALEKLNRPAEAEQFAASWGVPAAKPARPAAASEHVQQRGRASGGEGIRAGDPS